MILKLGCEEKLLLKYTMPPTKDTTCCSKCGKKIGTEQITTQSACINLKTENGSFACKYLSGSVRAASKNDTKKKF